MPFFLVFFRAFLWLHFFSCIIFSLEHNKVRSFLRYRGRIISHSANALPTTSCQKFRTRRQTPAWRDVAAMMRDGDMGAVPVVAAAN